MLYFFYMNLNVEFAWTQYNLNSNKAVNVEVEK